MKIEKIKIENFRGILEEELVFDEQLNVFIGSNGAGKTSMLDAIAQSLFKIVLFFNIQISIKTRNTLTPSSSHVNHEKKYFQILTFLANHGGETRIPVIVQEGNISRYAKIEKEVAEKKFHQFRKDLLEKIGNQTITIPIFKYYPANRGSISYSDFNNRHIYKAAQLESWSNIYQDSLAYSKFFKWFFDYETKELRLKRDKNNLNVESKELAPIRRVINKAFKLLHGKEYVIKSDQIKRNGSNELIPTLILEDEATGISEDLNSKSDGEKAIITLIADIAYNLAIAKNFSEGEDYLASPGMVLIDEIEAHLHPTWQREIIPLLTTLFPKIQFFITTHSPQVLSSVASQHIFICEDFKFSKINIKSKGLDSNSLLKYVFNSTERPKRYVELLEKFDAIIENEGSIQELKDIIDEIDSLDAVDKGQDIDLLITELNLKLEAYKFDLAHETHS